MSVISENHTIVSYTSGVTQALTGQRLSKVTYKVGTNGIKKESRCVSVPVLQVSEVQAQIDALMSAVVEMCAGVQDKIVRERVEAGALHVTGEEIGIAAIVQYLNEESSESGRLTKESIGVWFDSEVSEMLALTLAERLGVSEVPTDAESKQVMKVLESFKGKICALAGGKTSYEPALCKSLIKCMELAPAGDTMAARFTGRLEKMIAVNVGNDLLNCL